MEISGNTQKHKIVKQRKHIKLKAVNNRGETAINTKQKFVMDKSELQKFKIYNWLLIYQNKQFVH